MKYEGECLESFQNLPKKIFTMFGLNSPTNNKQKIKKYFRHMISDFKYFKNRSLNVYIESYCVICCSENVTILSFIKKRQKIKA